MLTLTILPHAVAVVFVFVTLWRHEGSSQNVPIHIYRNQACKRPLWNLKAQLSMYKVLRCRVHRSYGISSSCVSKIVQFLNNTNSFDRLLGLFSQLSFLSKLCRPNSTRSFFLVLRITLISYLLRSSTRNRTLTEISSSSQFYWPKFSLFIFTRDFLSLSSLQLLSKVKVEHGSQSRGLRLILNHIYWNLISF